MKFIQILIALFMLSGCAGTSYYSVSLPDGTKAKVYDTKDKASVEVKATVTPGSIGEDGRPKPSTYSLTVREKEVNGSDTASINAQATASLAGMLIKMLDTETVPQ